MNKNSSSRSSPPRKSGSLLIGILLGMVIGLIIAGGVAWYILKRPSPFMNNVPHETVKLAPDLAKPVAPPRAASAPSANGDASAVGDGKPRFEFYKVLTDKDGTTPAPGTDNAQTREGGPRETYLLQAGAFNNPEDADKLKARLAILGLEASVQSVTLPDKVVWHRVRLGPYRSQNEMNKTLATLKQNGIDATPTRPQ